MADETKVQVHEEQDTPVDSIIPESTAPGLETVGFHVQEDSDVVVDFEKVNQLMAERRVAAREEVERNEPDASGHEEQTENTDSLIPGDGDGAALTQEGDSALSGGDGASTKVIDFSVTGGPDNREPWEKTQDELDAEQGKKPRRGRPPKDKDGPKAEKTGKPRKGRQPKADKAAPELGKGERDKVSQSKDGKEPDPPATGGPAPAVEAESVTKPPRPIEDAAVVYPKLSDLHPFHTFRQHPFKVVDDGAMKELAGLIRKQGVIVPATVRPEKDGNGYEIIAGHRRHHSCELLGLDEIPCIVREMTDHEAVEEMKNSNKQRGEPLPSELAALLDLEVEDIKHQGTRLKGVAEGDIGKRSVEIVGEAHGLNYKKVMRYLRLNSLVPELLEKVDGALDENGKRKKGIGFMPAVELSYIRPKNQRLIAVSMDGEQTSPSVAQAKRLRELDEKNLLNGDVIDQILCEEKKEVGQVIITTSELNKYFGEEKTPRQMKEQILALLDEWKEKQPPEKKAPEQTAER